MSYVYMDLTSPSHLSAEDIDGFVAGTPLAGLGQAFMSAEHKHGVNARYLLAHAILESGWGKTPLAREKNNLYGFQAYDDSPLYSAKSFKSFAECIDYCAGYIKQNYLTPGGRYYVTPNLVGMNQNYATDPSWAWKIAAIMAEIPAGDMHAG